MTYIVNNERFVSLKPNFEKVYNEKWELITDSHGFRLVKNKISEKKNILFIGDSVPFGWGVNVEETVPGKLNDLLITNNIDVGINNAAIPSYLLDQSVHQYIYEIKDKFRINIIVLQIYNPANNFSSLGENWNTRINYTNTSTLFNYKNYIDGNNWLKYSSLRWLYYRFTKTKTYYSPILSSEAIEYYKKSLTISLNLLIKNLGEAQIILLPVNVPMNTCDEMSNNSRKSISILNNLFSDYSVNKNNIFYLDIRPLFERTDKLLFIDKCCHLSGDRASIQAQAIYKKY